MQVSHCLVSPGADWPPAAGVRDGLQPQFALVFGPRRVLAQRAIVAGLQAAYPNTCLVFASTSGDISGAALSDGKLAVTAVRLERSKTAAATVSVSGRGDSREAGRELARQLAGPELRHVFVLCDGRSVNGTQLALGLNETLPPGTTVTGGLAGDGTAFEETLVGLNEVPTPNRIAAIGFYSRHLRVGYGSSGGWIPFGPERVVTRAEGHELFELDGQPALALYKKYLGDAAAELPTSALRFPLSVRPSGGSAAVVRTPHRIDEAAGSLDFAGDIPEGASVRMLRASYEDLIDGAGRAAEAAMKDQLAPELAICVSCVARRIVLGQRTEEELENVREVIGANTTLCGFYSYGELAPINGDPACHFHNQTMTITTLREEPA